MKTISFCLELNESNFDHSLLKRKKKNWYSRENVKRNTSLFKQIACLTHAESRPGTYREL